MTLRNALLAFSLCLLACFLSSGGASADTPICGADGATTCQDHVASTEVHVLDPDARDNMLTNYVETQSSFVQVPLVFVEVTVTDEDGSTLVVDTGNELCPLYGMECHDVVLLDTDVSDGGEDCTTDITTGRALALCM